MVLSKPKSLENDLKSAFIACKNFVHTIFEVTTQREVILHWFQSLCKHLTETISLIGSYYKELQEESSAPTHTLILLYLTQLLTSLSLLINIFVQEEETKVVLTESRKCVVKQISCCLESIQVSFDHGTSLPDCSGNFVKWMDTALERVSEININAGKIKAREMFAESRETFEEVLSHAMSIAQVSLEEDGKSIRGGCQSVLSTLNSLEKEIENINPNIAMISLFIDACSDKLCLLEKRVNTAVLKMCLNTFSHYTLPLERIYKFCFDLTNKCKIEELDGLVADFDLHVDRIMQIGLFAVSCSSDVARGIRIRSCLASLEALESELVPSLTTVLLDRSSHNVNSAEVLMKHWLEQALCLQKVIYLIIDPFAFCQVMYEAASEEVDSLVNSLKRRNSITRSEVGEFVATVKVLKSFMEEAQSEFNQSELKKVQTKITDFKEVLEEVEKASSLLLNNEKNDVEGCKRVLKRCKILLTVLKRLWLCFADEIPHSENAATLDKSLNDLVSNVENLNLEPTGNPFLDHIINRGKQILQDRSVLYKTPIKNLTIVNSPNAAKITKSTRHEVPLSRLVHLRKFSFVNASHRSENSLNLQITDILNEMGHLSASFKPQDAKAQTQLNKF